MRFPMLIATIAALSISASVLGQEAANKKVAVPAEKAREKVVMMTATMRLNMAAAVKQGAVVMLPPGGKIAIAEAEAKGVHFDGIAKTADGPRLQFTLANGQIYQDLELSIKTDGDYSEMELDGELVRFRKSRLR